VEKLKDEWVWSGEKLVGDSDQEFVCSDLQLLEMML